MRASALDVRARKLLSFTDNRQDASLQAGHFNDFVEIGLLRGALYKAVAAAGPEGLRHESLTPKVFEALALPVAAYSSNPDVKFQGEGGAARGVPRRRGLPPLPRPEAGLAGHLAQPGAVRPAGDLLPVAGRAVRRRGRVERHTPGPRRGHARDPTPGVQ